jgi:hypothetical protein
MLGGSRRRVKPAVHRIIALTVVIVAMLTGSVFAARVGWTSGAASTPQAKSDQSQTPGQDARRHRRHHRHKHRYRHHHRRHHHRRHHRHHAKPKLGSPPPIPTPSPGVSPVLFNREVLQYPSPPTASQARYNVIVLQSTESKYIPLLRQFNPHVKIFMYMYAMWANAADPTGLELCTALPQDLANPTWFLKDSSGANLTRSGNYEMDVGNPGYQQACASHVIALGKQLGFDGIDFDGINTNLAYSLAPGTNPSIPEYPTITAWQAAMYSFLVNTSATIHANGLMVIGNIGGANSTIWKQWNGPMDGAEEESWTDGGLGFLQQVPAWPMKLGNAAWSEANGKIMIVHTYDTTEAGNTYALASMMLVAGGHMTYSTTNAGIASYEMWYPEYSEAQLLGRALGSYQQLSNGVYERRFANGVVLANPTPQAVGTFSLGGGTYSGSGLSGVSSVSMGPTSGLILLRVG